MNEPTKEEVKGLFNLLVFFIILYVVYYFGAH